MKNNYSEWETQDRLTITSSRLIEGSYQGRPIYFLSTDFKAGVTFFEEKKALEGSPIVLIGEWESLVEQWSILRIIELLLKDQPLTEGSCIFLYKSSDGYILEEYIKNSELPLVAPKEHHNTSQVLWEQISIKDITPPAGWSVEFIMKSTAKNSANVTNTPS